MAAESQGNFAFDGGSVGATSMFANLLFNLKVVKLVGEIGQVTGLEGAAVLVDDPDLAALVGPTLADGVDDLFALRRLALPHSASRRAGAGYDASRGGAMARCGAAARLRGLTGRRRGLPPALRRFPIPPETTLLH